jgi:hypothetical protein
LAFKQSWAAWLAAWQAVVMSAMQADVAQLRGSFPELKHWHRHAVKAAQEPSPPKYC